MHCHESDKCLWITFQKIQASDPDWDCTNKIDQTIADGMFRLLPREHHHAAE
jgi:hypothetical protein